MTLTKGAKAVSPWWMYCWLRDWAPQQGRWRAALHTLPTWWALWSWAASPDGYEGDYADVRWGRPPGDPTP